MVMMAVRPRLRVTACQCQVGRAVFNEAILGAMKGKTRVLATNQLQYARQADIAVLMQVPALASSSNLPLPAGRTSAPACGQL